MYGTSSGPASCEPPSGPSWTIAPVTPGTSATRTRSASRYSASKGSSHDDVFAIVCSVFEFRASPTEPSSPPSSPAPKTIRTAIPFALAERKIEPRSASAATTTTAAARRTPAPTGSLGHQSPNTPVTTTAPA